MRFESPYLLLLLWLLPALALLLFYSERRRRAALCRFMESPMADRLAPTRAGWRPWFRGAALIVGVGLLMVAAARPRFGVKFEEVRARGVDLYVLLDVSRSMLAEDVRPNRLERAKSDINDLLQKLGGDRVGLIVFAGSAIVQAPLTNDQGFFRQALEQVDVNSAPRGGSMIGDAIRKALVSMERRADRDQALVVITDGEDHDSFPGEAAKEAAQLGVKIFTVGLGDNDSGARIPIRGEQGLKYLEHDGKAVVSRMDGELLRDIALQTGGAYIPAQTRTYDLGRIYEDHLASLTRGDYSERRRKTYHEQFAWFLVLGLGCLLAETLTPKTANQPEIATTSNHLETAS